MFYNGFKVLQEDVLIYSELFWGGMSRYLLSNGSTEKLYVCICIWREKTEKEKEHNYKILTIDSR